MVKVGNTSAASLLKAMSQAPPNPQWDSLHSKRFSGFFGILNILGVLGLNFLNFKQHSVPAGSKRGSYGILWAKAPAIASPENVRFKVWSWTQWSVVIIHLLLAALPHFLSAC